MTEQTFDRELVVRWIEALESGKYEQGHKALHPTSKTYCCLGVLVDQAVPDFLPGSEQWLSSSIARAVGLSVYGEQPGRPLWQIRNMKDASLGYLNDNGATFTDIAAALREHYQIPKAS